MLRNGKKRYFMFLPGLFLLAVMMMVGTVWAQTFDLCAGQVEKTLPDGQTATVWGLGLDAAGTCTPTVPGPVLRVDAADPTLVINLRNTLNEPVSLHILGQRLTNNAGPVWDGGTTGPRPNLTARVRSFSHEAAANGGTAQYQWTIEPGTHMVQSGSNPAKQVQMGLAAPVIKDAVAAGVGTPAEAYTGVPYDKELILVFQEIDPSIHAAVAAGTYGPGGTITSSIYRDPHYFLINGLGFPAPGLNPINAGIPMSVGDRILLRFINSGAQTHMPMLLGDYFTQVAEDGYPLKYGKQVYSMEMNPAKTLDAIYVPASPGRLPILDSRLELSNAGASPGGMLAFMNVGGVAAGGDTVTISGVAYDATAKTLTVSATSNQQPNVQLTAAGFGGLGWKSWLNLYRTTFTGVAAKPTEILVTSSGGGSAVYTFPPVDTVTIASVAYDATAKTLTVSATSNQQPNVALSAGGYGALGWKSWLNLYRTTFNNVATRPASVTVTSNGGGSATYTFPAVDTVTIQRLTYSAGSLTVVATSTSQPNVALTATGYGALGWKSWLNFYRTTFTGLTAKPATVTVTSSGGGSATMAVP